MNEALKRETRPGESLPETDKRSALRHDLAAVASASALGMAIEWDHPTPWWFVAILLWNLAYNVAMSVGKKLR